MRLTGLTVVASASLCVFGASAAQAQTGTASFTTQGCSVFTVPLGVSSVSVDATGAAGQTPGSALTPSGLGDGVSAIVGGLTGGSSQLDVCVDEGGGPGLVPGFAGGGASGVSLGSDFSHPLVVAGGGGAAGRNSAGDLIKGGNAGQPIAGAGDNDPTFAGVTGGSGGDNTAGSGGAGGTGANPGFAGSKFTAAGPGAGGRQTAVGEENNGPFIGAGAGGGGLYGGGSGGARIIINATGGGGGSDLCVNGGSVTGCSVSPGAGIHTVAGADPGAAHVVLTYTLPSLSFQNLPADITTNATGPGGATVTYTAPSALLTGQADPNATVVCSPASGTTFSIGQTTVTCTATDPAAGNSPYQQSFHVTVKGAREQLSALAAAVRGVGPGTSLADKIASVQTALGANQTGTACGTLVAFVHEVRAQAGKSISPSTAATLIATAQQIAAVIPCTS